MSTPLVKPLHLSREWTRLPESGGHTRRTKESRPLSAKTVRNIAGMVSGAFARGIKWGLVVKVNPATNNEPPKVQQHIAIALTPSATGAGHGSRFGPVVHAGVSGDLSRDRLPQR